VRDGSFDTHLRRLLHANESRRDALVTALRTHLPGTRVSGADAGTHVLLTLPPEAPTASAVQQAALALGVGVQPLADSPAWFVEHLDNADRCLLLGYTHLTEAQIEQGIAGLGRAVRMAET
jgi:GntR family transcriptional regulator/MocR family aminotransferase